LRRLRIANAAMPRIMPAIMDSQGKPGIGGKASGVEAEDETETMVSWDVVEGVLVAVLVTAELAAVVEEVAVLDVTRLVELTVDVLELATVLVALALVLDVVVVLGVVVTPPPPEVGIFNGSR
jgi:hypothetical protein